MNGQRPESDPTPRNDGHSEPSLPVAQVHDRPASVSRIFKATRMWLLTLACGVIALVLVSISWFSPGTQVTITFQDGYGLKPGDTLNYRGIDVGEVTQVEVDADLEGVTICVELQPNAAYLAREGSQFWIERPQLGLGRISGLETVVGAKYLGVIPGEAGAANCYDFIGTESPPVIRDGNSSEITIDFEQGHGIDTGAVVRHLGIVVGEVTGVQMASDLDRVTVSVRLSETASHVARSGSLFWIERPELGLSEIRGLATLISGPYIDFIPGPETAPTVRHFQGAPQAPPATRKTDGLELILTSDQQRALRPGVPVNYRGLMVGHVVSVRLSSDASSVQARIYIEPDYKSLVCANTKFWSNIGIDADFGVTGIQLKTDSLQSLVSGSVGFATPDSPGRPARTGERFECGTTFQPEWLEWSPKIAIGNLLLPSGKNRPDSFRSALKWKEKRYTFTRNMQEKGWLVLLSDKKLVGLPRYLKPPEGAIAGTTFFEMSGLEFPFEPAMLAPFGELQCYRIGDQKITQSAWPLEQLRRPNSAEDCLIVSDPQADIIPLASTHIERTENGRWFIDPAVSYNPDLDGACVISRVDGAIVGFLDLSLGQAQVIFVPNR